jgi:hypothetical protein
MRYDALAKLPIRMLGLLLLAVAVSVASCQALIHGLTEPTTEAIQQRLDSDD